MDDRASGSTWGFDEEEYETEKMARTADWRGSGSTRRFDEGTQRRQEMPDKMDVHSQATNLDWSEPKARLDERIQSDYLVRPGEIAFRSVWPWKKLPFDHPPCEFFRRGACKNGSDCKLFHTRDSDVPRLPMRQAISSTEFFHPKDRDGAEPMRQGPRRNETESVSMPEKRASKERIIRDSRDRDPRQRSQEMIQRLHGNDWVFNIEKKHNRSLPQIRDEIVSGYLLKEERQRENTERQRREAQEDAQERIQRDTSVRQRCFEKKMREAQENAQEQRLMETPVNHNVDAHGQDNLQEQRQRENIEWVSISFKHPLGSEKAEN